MADISSELAEWSVHLLGIILVMDAYVIREEVDPQQRAVAAIVSMLSLDLVITLVTSSTMPH
jgi:hypothetical protein